MILYWMYMPLYFADLAYNTAAYRLSKGAGTEKYLV